MSQIQQQLRELSAKEAQGSEELGRQIQVESGDQEQLVPVAEAIKYRRRAQTAEQQVRELSEQLQILDKEQRASRDGMEAAVRERDLTSQLVSAGAQDIEVALLLAKEHVKATDGEVSDTQSIVAAIRHERPHLFSNNLEEVRQVLARPTAGVRPSGDAGVTSLKRFAEQARSSGNRTDMQEYLRLRRCVVG